MTPNEQVVVLFAASICILIFLATVACAGYSYKKDHTLVSILFIVALALGMANMLLTMHFLWIAMSAVSGGTGFVMGAILHHIYGTQPKTSEAATGPLPAGKVRGR